MNHTQKDKQKQREEEDQDKLVLLVQEDCPTQNPNLEGEAAMHHQEASDPFFGGRSSLMFPPHHHHNYQEVLPWQLQANQFNQPEPFLFPPPPPPLPNLFGRRPHHLQFGGYDVGPSGDPLRILSEALGQPPFGLQMQAELNRMTSQEIMDAKALAASKSHSEAERRRRERINNHLAKLRSLLPSTTKTDKASLLAEVIQHVKELKRQTSVIAESNTIPTESDELTVDPAAEVDYEGRAVLRASMCCDDRVDLMPDLIKALKALRLRTLKAEITTLGGRVKNVLFVTGDDDNGDEQQWSATSIQEALRAVMDKSGNGGRDDSASASGNAKRQRTNIIT